MRRPTVFLFDIDGTLLLTGGAGRRAIEAAFAAHTGRADACAGFSFGGLTDRHIVRKGLTAVGEQPSEARIEAVIEAYLQALAVEVPASSGYVIMPGVMQVVAALREQAGCAVGLGTGNVRRGAEIKLARGDLWRHFDFGGFGCDDEDRTALLAVGRQRGAARLGISPAAARVVVIGDTVRDVDAARGIGAECLGVATGGISVDELLRAGATCAYADLTIEAARQFLFG